tara:strand:- start:845 stop:1324 length:480 start_codon:yes stop_codon:yes gene_type:complete
MALTKTCTSCKTETPANRKFCSFCRKELPAADTSTDIRFDNSFFSKVKRFVNTLVSLAIFVGTLLLQWWIFGEQLGIEGKTLWIPATIVSIVFGITVSVMVGRWFDISYGGGSDFFTSGWRNNYTYSPNESSETQKRKLGWGQKALVLISLGMIDFGDD